MNGLFEGNGRTEQSWVPVADVWETEDEFVFALDLPGIPEEKISVELDEGALTISASRERATEVSNERYHRVERRFGTFTRTVGLPQGVGDEDVKATYHDGVLEIHVRKPEQPKPRRIAIAGREAPTVEGSSKPAA
jgi:HSP20 family protein